MVLVDQVLLGVRVVRCLRLYQELQLCQVVQEVQLDILLQVICHQVDSH